MHPVFVARSMSALPIWFVTKATFAKVTTGLNKTDRNFIRTTDFTPAPGRSLVLPSGAVLFGLEGANDPQNAFLPGLLAGVLPAGTYRFGNTPHDARLAALAFALGTYKFTRYRKAKERALKLVLPEGIDGNDLTRMAEGVTLARDLINTPTNDLGPAELEVAARELAKQHGAKFRSIVGDALLKQNFPLIHAVGRIAYHGWIDNIQASWVKLGTSGAQQLLRAGVNDLGGTLMDENISRAAGAAHGQGIDEESFRAIVEPLGRTLAERTTLYATTG